MTKSQTKRVKKPITVYNYYSKLLHKHLRTQYNIGRTLEENNKLNKIVAERWKNAEPRVLQICQKLAQLDKIRYECEIAQQKKSISVNACDITKQQIYNKDYAYENFVNMYASHKHLNDPTNSYFAVLWNNMDNTSKSVYGEYRILHRK